MEWIFEHLNIVVILILVIGSFLKSRFDSVNQDTRESEDFPDYGDDGTPDESYRKMAPDQPPVPPPLPGASVPPPMPTATYTIPGASTIAAAEAAKILKHQHDLAEHLRQLRETKATTSGNAASTRARIAASKSQAKPLVAGPLALRSRLRDPAEVRRAVVMREILEKPIGLR